MEEAEGDTGMKASELIEAIERQFLDLIAYVLPGTMLMISALVLFAGLDALDNLPQTLGRSGYLVLLLIGAAYILGQALETAGNLLTQPAAIAVATLWRRIFSSESRPLIVRESELLKAVAADPAFRAATNAIRSMNPSTDALTTDASSVRSWRNIALTYANETQQHLTYRFMFISILSLGIATVSFMFIITEIFILVVPRCIVPLAFLSAHAVTRSTIAAAIVAGVLGPLFIRRRFEFFARSMRVPFSMVNVGDSKPKPVADLAPTVSNRATLTIYLAGGFRSAWQDTVKAELPLLTILDPREHNLAPPDQYTLWDLDAIRGSDWVLANLERHNPGGYALALEVGFAKALGKRILLIDQKSPHDPNDARRLEMVRACADVEFQSLGDAIFFIKQESLIRGA